MIARAVRPLRAVALAAALAAMPGACVLRTATPVPPPDVLFADPHVAAVATVAQVEAIQESQVALVEARHPAVRALATAVIDARATLAAELDALLVRREIAPVDNALSVQAMRNLPPTLAALRTRGGLEFDLAWATRQVAAHEQTLHTLDTSLIPSADDPVLRAWLAEAMRPVVAAQLDAARRLLAMLASSRD